MLTSIRKFNYFSPVSNPSLIVVVVQSHENQSQSEEQRNDEWKSTKRQRKCTIFLWSSIHILTEACIHFIYTKNCAQDATAFKSLGTYACDAMQFSFPFEKRRKPSIMFRSCTSVTCLHSSPRYIFLYDNINLRFLILLWNVFGLAAADESSTQTSAMHQTCISGMARRRELHVFLRLLPNRIRARLLFVLISLNPPFINCKSFYSRNP